jgi:two-component system sensor histidine kinase SenX3
MWWFVLVLVGVAAFVAGTRVTARRLDDADRSPTPALVAEGPAVTDVLEALHLGVAIAGRDGAGEFRNSAARVMSGTHAGLIIDDAIARHLARGLVGLSSDELVELYGPPKAVFVVESAPLPGGGAVAFVDDVSERRRVDQVRTDFVANVSHELKTPIGALSVLAETLQDEADLETVARLAGRMLAETERATNTIDDLMELSRIELGGDRVVEAVRFGDVVAGAVERVRELAAGKKIAISALEPVDGSGRRSDALIVAGDRRQLVSAVGNLVENAVKYSELGSSVQIRVRHDGATVELLVIDHGVGIPADAVDRVFERFYRVDQARSRVTGGSGLGLSIVRHVATNHGGDVSVVSSEGAGSTFTLRLPLVQPESGDDDHRARHRGEGVA